MKLLFFSVLSISLCIFSYHLGRSSKQYNWDRLSESVEKAPKNTVAQVVVDSKDCQPETRIIEQNARVQKNLIESVDKEMLISENEMLRDFTPTLDSTDKALQEAGDFLQNQGHSHNLPRKESEHSLSQELNISTRLPPDLETAHKAISNLPPYVLNKQLNRHFKTMDLDLINDQYMFSKRLSEEFLGEGDDVGINYNASMHFSLSRRYADPAVKEFMFPKKGGKAKIYAHLEVTSTQLVHSHVFVKWINVKNGEILLFKKRKISIGSPRNWVNFMPDGGWEPGIYQVKIYEFSDELPVIAEGSFFVYDLVVPDN